MKKRIILLILVLLSMTSAQAQFAKPLKNKHNKSWNKVQFSLGVTGGYAANDMFYSEVKKSALRPFFAPTFGFALEWNTFNLFSIGLDGSYSTHGTYKSFASELLTNYSSATFARVNYMMALNGIGARVPITFYIGIGEVIRPYFFVAPRINLWLNGQVKWERVYDNGLYQPIVYESELTKALIRPFDLSTEFGLGLCGKLRLGWRQYFIKFDLGYGMSIMNNFSRGEINEEVVFQGWGDIAHEKLGKRYLCNLEARLTFLMSLHRLVDDPCMFNQKPYYKK